MVTTKARERILVVEPDPEIADLIARQSLQPLRYRVKVVGEAGAALQESARFAPHLIIADMHLPDLSGKDLLAALQSQGDDVPIIVVGTKGEERDIIQAFRLGASDFLLWPMQDTEVVSAVERVLKQVRERQAKIQLARQLQKANQELQRRVRELTTLFDLAKAVASVTNQKVLFQRLVEGALRLAEADKGWMFLREENGKGLTLVAQQGLPRSLAARLGQTWDDGLSSLVALSGEALSIHGDPLRRFKIYSLGKSALVVPVKVKNEVVALLAVVRNEARPFTPEEQALLEAIADYASIALVNARLFQALEEHAKAMQRTAKAAREGERLKSEILQNLSHELRTPLGVAQGYVEMLMEGQMGDLSEEQRHALETVRQKLAQIGEVVSSVTALQSVSLAPDQWARVNLNDLARLAVTRHKPRAQQKKLTLEAQTAADEVTVLGDPDQLGMVFDHLITNAIKFTPEGGQIEVSVRRDKGELAHVVVKDTGIGISSKHLPHIFERFYQVDGSTTRRFGGLGLGLSVVKEIVEAHGGKVWAESKKNKGTLFHFVLPIASRGSTP